MRHPSWLRPAGDGLHLRIHAQPGARHTQLIGRYGDALKIKIHAPPVDGKANQELLHYLAKRLQCKKQQIQLVSGRNSRDKYVLIQGMEAADVAKALPVE